MISVWELHLLCAHTHTHSGELPESAHTQMYTITLVKSLCCVDQWPDRSSRKVANVHFFLNTKGNLVPK